MGTTGAKIPSAGKGTTTGARIPSAGKGTTGAKILSAGKGKDGKGKGKNGGGGGGNDSDPLQINTTVGAAKALLRALSLNLALDGSSASDLITAVSRALLSVDPKNGKKKNKVKGKSGKTTGVPKTIGVAKTAPKGGGKVPLGKIGVSP
jgi:hypothetical protein